MHALDFLKGFPDKDRQSFISVEYRLLCSGELFNQGVPIADWRKSAPARVLCESPITLLAVNNPTCTFPQELALRFSVPLVVDEYPNVRLMHYPDEEIARDLAALLSLFCRRLISVATKAREQHPETPGDVTSLRDCPMPVINSYTPVHWKHKPLSFIHCIGKPTEIVDYNPVPLGIRPSHLSEMLRQFATCSSAECLVLSARLYALALTQLESDIDLAYHSLIASVEAIATVALSDYCPTDDRMAEVKKSVARLAGTFGVAETHARQLAIEACKGMTWAKAKFTQFLVQNCTDGLWTKDDLFRMPTEFAPTREDFEKSLGEIYSARSGMTHSGKPFPQSAILGMGATVPVKAIVDLGRSGKPFPPVGWFERVVNNALNSYIVRSRGETVMP